MPLDILFPFNDHRPLDKPFKRNIPVILRVRNVHQICLALVKDAGTAGASIVSGMNITVPRGRGTIVRNFKITQIVAAADNCTLFARARTSGNACSADATTYHGAPKVKVRVERT